MNDPKNLRKSGKPTRVEDINSVMENQNYMVIKGNKNPGDDPDMDDSMNTHNMKSKGKAWQDWWKKKRNVSEDLLMAAEMGNLEKVISLIDKEQQGEFTANIRFQGLDNFTALHFAAQEGRKDV